MVHRMILFLLFFATVPAMAASDGLSCTGRSTDGDYRYYMTMLVDDKTSVFGQELPGRNAEGFKNLKALGRNIKVRKSSKEDTYDVVAEGKVLFTLRHSGNPSDRKANGELNGLQMQCRLNRDFAEYNPPQGRKEFCAHAKNPAKAQDLLKDPRNRLAFTNASLGLFDAGVCWWYNRFERNAAILAVYRPDRPAPTKTQATALVASIKAGDRVVEIPGFRNLREFSLSFRDEIVRALEAWQIADGVGFAWLRGISGATRVSAAGLRKTMDETFDLVEKRGLIAFHLIQMPGVAAHSWLVLDMKKTKTGYSMLVADSDHVGASLIEYRNGDTQLPVYNGAPFLQNAYNEEALRAVKIAQKSCAAQK